MGTEDSSFGSDLALFAKTPTVVGASFGGTDRYELVRLLGEGSFGIVYEARDRERDRSVALKLLRKIQPSWLLRFKREFRSLAEVTHPNLVALHELVATDAHCFFTMDLVSGEPLGATRIGPRPREVFSQLAEGLAALHAAGILHRDVKPSNVLLEDSGRVVLVDFGLAIERDARLSTVIAGTPHYMAPELFAGAPPTEASDWFAVGVMLYEALTSVLVDARAPQHRATESPIKPVREIAPAADLALADLAMSLLAADPDERPSGSEVLATLGTPASQRAAPTESFIGRERELTVLRQAWERVEPGAPHVVFFAADSGMGKSALFRKFLDETGARPDALVLHHRCHQQESVPFKAFDGVIDQLSRELCRLPAVEAERVTPRHAGALIRLFPVLAQVRALARSAPSKKTEIAELRLRGIEALRELFTRLADQRRIVVAIDDLQWGDADSARLLARLLRSPDAPPFLFVGMHRGGERRDSAFFQELEERCGDLLRGVPIENGTLRGLSDDEARRLFAASGQTDVVPSDLLRDAGGNPFFLIELAQNDATSDGNITLDALLERRMSLLDARARELLTLLVVAEEPLPEAVARHAMDGDVEDVVRELRRTRWVVRRPSGTATCLELAHHRLQSVVRGGVDDVEGVHKRLADAFEAVLPDASESIGMHLLEAGERVPARSHIQRAAQRAFDSGANQLASRLFERCLHLYERHERGTPDALDVVRRLGETLRVRGFGKRAAEACLSAARYAPRDEAFELRVQAMRELLANGYLDEGRRLLHDLLAEVDLSIPTGSARRLAALTAAMTQIKVSRYRFTLRDRNTIDPLQLRRLRVLTAATNGLFGIEPEKLTLLLAQLVRLALDVGDAEYLGDALAFSVGLLSVMGFTRESRRLRRVLSALAEQTGSLNMQAHLHATEGWSRVAAGDWVRGAELMQQVNDTGASVGVWGTRGRHAVFNGHYWTGNIAAAARDLPPHLELMREQSDRLGYLWMSLIQSWVLCAHDQPDEAIALIDRVSADWPGGNSTFQDVWTRNNRGMAALYRGDADAARDHFTIPRAWRVILKLFASHNPDFVTQQSLCIANVDLLALRGASRWKRRALVRSARAHIEAAEKAGVPYGLAWAQAQRGAIAWHSGDEVGAIDHFATSEPMLTGVGMHQVVAAVRRAQARLMGGEDGRRMQSLSDDYMREHGIVNPERFCGMYLVTPL